MMDNILHRDTGIGAILGDTSSRSDSSSRTSTTTTKTYTLSNGTVITMSDAVYKTRDKIFIEAFGLAYSNNIAAPSRDEMMQGNISAELNALRQRYTAKTGNTFVQLSDNTLLTMPVADYNERNAIYTQAYGLAYSNNVTEPDFDECFKGNGAAELQKVQGRIVAKQAAAQVAAQQAAAEEAEEETAEEIEVQTSDLQPQSEGHTDTTPTPRRTDPDYVAPESRTDSNQPRSATAAAATSPATADGTSNVLLWLLLGAGAIGLVVMASKSNSKKRKR
jgi:hypothetical protein